VKLLSSGDEIQEKEQMVGNDFSEIYNDIDHELLQD
jgi:hypothetical protein